MPVWQRGAELWHDNFMFKQKSPHRISFIKAPLLPLLQSLSLSHKVFKFYVYISQQPKAPPTTLWLYQTHVHLRGLLFFVSFSTLPFPPRITWQGWSNCRTAASLMYNNDLGTCFRDYMQPISVWINLIRTYQGYWQHTRKRRLTQEATADS